jgi:hypothetical protein
MNELLWKQIVAFDFDNPPAEYSFTLRLAHENNWTKNFALEAILEYKKFMYLAATAQGMVSPSKIVDIVWHQHLIFTQSYNDFCQILGKRIQHIPSTHDKKDFKKFQEAASRTKQLYATHFGKQPKAFWTHDDIYGSLNLRKSKLSLTAFAFLGVTAILLCMLPFRALMEPLYLQIQGANFLLWFIGGAAVLFALLDLYNRSRMHHIVKKADKDAFIYQLKPSEAVYAKKLNIAKVINGFVNQLVSNRTINIGSDYQMKLNHKSHDNSQEQIQIVNALDGYGKTHYPALLQTLATKPVFANTAQAIDELKKYYMNSTAFRSVFYFNFVAIALFNMFGVGRVITGLQNNKEVTFLAILAIVLFSLSIGYLRYLTRFILKVSLSGIYKQMLNKKANKEQKAHWEWDYYLREDAVLNTAFVPVAGYIDKNSNGGTSCGSSCGSSCGGGCGGGCGGCGG